MSDSPYTVLPRTASPTEYRLLCESVGWGEVMNFAVAEQALSRSLFGVVVLHQQEVVAMGRIVGDGAIFFYLQDLVVHPEHQGRGLGDLLVQHLLAHLKEHAPPLAFVGLFSAAGKEGFYRRHGFEQHAGLTGMFQVMPPAAQSD